MEELPRRKPVFERRQVGSIQKRFAIFSAWLEILQNLSAPAHVIGGKSQNSRLFETFGVIGSDRPICGAIRRSWSARRRREWALSFSRYSLSSSSSDLASFR